MVPREPRTHRRRFAATPTPVGQALGWKPEAGRLHLFEVDIQDVTSIRYGDSGDQFVASWPPAREFVRRGTSATSVGTPEAVRDLLVQ